MSKQPQNALNKTPAELSKLSDQRLENVLKAARKNFISKEANSDSNEEITAAESYLARVKAECSTRSHFE